MRLSIILILLALCFSCASEMPSRKIASIEENIQPSEVDHKQSSVQVFPAIADADGVWYNFFVQVKDHAGNFVDCDPKDILLKTSKGKNINFNLQRSSVGRYYVTLEKTAHISNSQMDFFVQGKPLREQFKLEMSVPDKQHSSIKIVANENNVITFELRLADKANKLVDTDHLPDIILDGHGMLDGMKKISKGIWHFSVIYPEENQIMYFSVRAQGMLLHRIHRYQHVEKWVEVPITPCRRNIFCD